MKAAVYHGKMDIRVEQVADKTIEKDEVLIKTAYCGVCGTDVNIYNGAGGAFAVNPPLIPGHEFSGIVEKVGDAVKGLKPGDHVTADPNIMCGKCYYCRNQLEQFCTDNIGIGTTADGGFAEQVAMKASHVVKVPDSMDLLAAAMTEPTSCCVHGVDLCHLKAGDTVLVIGGGPIGMIAMQLAKLSGARVVMSEPVERKRLLALELGADAAIDPTREDVEAFLNDFTQNVNCVFECVGNVHTEADAIRYAGKAATIMLFGLTGPDATLSVRPEEIFKKELKITSSFINPYTFSRAATILAAGAIDVKKIITTIAPLEKLPEILDDPSYRRDGKCVIKL